VTELSAFELERAAERWTSLEQFHLEFEERFGARGQNPQKYYGVEVAHVLPGVTRETIGRLRARDILAAHKIFGLKWRNEGGE